MLIGFRRAAVLLTLLAACGDDPSKRPEEDAGKDEEPAAEVDARAPSQRDATVVDARQAPDAEIDDPDLTDAQIDDPEVDAGVAQDAGPKDPAAQDAATLDAATQDAGPLPFTPAFHIPLRVHHGDSALTGAQLTSILAEVNEIWWKQAAVCFEVEFVKDDKVRTDGFDFWFHRTTLGCNTTANGVYCGDHDIHSLDKPSLGKADDAQWNVRQLPARTAAHELGHGLGLSHYNGFADSNDSLMSSGRQGFKLHDSELTTSRGRAQRKAIANSPSTPCATVTATD